MGTLTIFLRKGLLVTGALCMSVTAQAQFSPDSNAPINGAADSAVSEPGLTIFSGQVDVRQGDVRILSDTMKVFSSSNNSTEAFDDVSRIEAIGNFYYLTPEQEVRGKRGVYERASDTFTVTGDVILLQGEDNIVTGDTLIYNLNSSKAKVIGSCKGRRCGRKGRVSILIKNSGNTSGANPS